MADLGPPALLPPPPPGSRPLAAWPPPPPPRCRDGVGIVGQLLWAPLVFVGAVGAASIWLTVFGLPLLLVSLPPFLACGERRCGRRAPRSLVVAGLVVIPVIDVGAVVAVAFAAGDPAAYAGLVAVAAWSIAATIVLLRLRSGPVDVSRAVPEVLGLWLLVLWVPMAVALLWPTGFVIGAPFMALALAPCQAGRLRHRGHAIPQWLLVVSSGAVATWTVAAVVAVVNQDGLLLHVLTLAALLPWVAPAVVTNVLLWRRPAFRPGAGP